MEKIDEIYQSIAHEIIEEIEIKNWSLAKIVFDYYGDAGNFDCIYKIEAEEIDFDIEFSMYENFEKLYEITTKDNSNKWNRSIFILYPNGKFEIDFQYNQELADKLNKA